MIKYRGRGGGDLASFRGILCSFFKSFLFLDETKKSQILQFSKLISFWFIMEIISLGCVRELQNLLNHRCLLFADSKFPGVILGDISVLPDVEVILLCQVHSLLVTGDQLGKSSAPLLLDHEKSVSDQALANVIGCVLGLHEGHESLEMWKMLKIYIYFSGDLKSGLVWISNGQREVGLQMVQILYGI